MSKLIQRIEFDYMWEGDNEEERVNMAQLKFPYYSPEDRGPKVIFKTDKQLDSKMKKVRRLNKEDLRGRGIKLLALYDLDNLSDVLSKMIKKLDEEESE